MSRQVLSEIDRWRTGFPLETAWSGLADPDQRRSYHQVAGDEQQRRSQYLQMVATLWQRLSAGELKAYGWKVTPSDSDQPVRIPAAMFDSPPDKADLDIGRFRFHSWCFDNVKVLEPDVVAMGCDDTGIKEPAKAAPTETRRGRPRFDSILRQATRVVAANDPTFSQRSAEKQNGMIQEAAAQLFPGRFSGKAGPGRSTIARFIKAEREEGWPALSRPENPEIPK